MKEKKDVCRPLLLRSFYNPGAHKEDIIFIFATNREGDNDYFCAINFHTHWV